MGLALHAASVKPCNLQTLLCPTCLVQYCTDRHCLKGGNRPTLACHLVSRIQDAECSLDIMQPAACKREHQAWN